MVTSHSSRKPLVRELAYGATGQVRDFTCSDEPGYRWAYIYDGLARRVAKEKIHSTSGEVVHRVAFVHDGDSLVAEQSTIDDPSDTSAGHPAAARRGGLVWVTDPATGELLGQITLTASRNSALVAPVQGRWSGSGAAGAATAPQHQVDAVFHAMVTDLASAPRELIDPDTGKAADRVVQSLYGRRTWHGEVACPLLFAGQYEDAESGWVYNRFRYYDPTAGIYSTQDPLGVAPRLAAAQGYVGHAWITIDVFGLHGCGDQLSMYRDRGNQARDELAGRFPGSQTVICMDSGLSGTKTNGQHMTGEHYIDVYLPEDEVGMEQKTGKATGRSFIKHQVDKDIALVNGGQLQEARWYGDPLCASHDPSTGQYLPDDQYTRGMRDHLESSGFAWNGNEGYYAYSR
ncbi:RHS repeat-associated core domain-containing protein [Corynebacterium sp. AOP40-9SA-29]|uniref:RHS repeat-associated core domain-containing protein n=1 Tax=Corynebacterium sp. AOP40-9SA-29 TaxID=3457677 RepID=UPI004034BEF4